MKQEAAESSGFEIVDSALMMKVFCGLAVLAALSLAISFGGRWFGHTIAMAGYTDDMTTREIVIGNDVIAAPANTIRFEKARRDGVASRLDLYLRWPELDGYSEAARPAFNNLDGNKRIIFVSLEPRVMTRDMSGRLAPIYNALTVKPGVPGPEGMTLFGFSETSGYLNEVLAVAARSGEPAFVARCLNGTEADESLAPCERDVFVGNGLSMTYRFPRELLGDWRALDAAIVAKANAMLHVE
ncbi:hypothetical protein ACFFTN_25440 [Aminobacter aganoensis]|uniref:Uncharacterized protein n=1 Tax=Aminobacter aganoensis TaxID=83264 RepID=A0A7X0F7K5_9HYPH|nr:hypothetical protein [Aminobacter aganoensis]MBB6354611.1 hypothetical protein [Aminobacter aganoensis]